VQIADRKEGKQQIFTKRVTIVLPLVKVVQAKVARCTPKIRQRSFVACSNRLKFSYTLYFSVPFKAYQIPFHLESYAG